MGMGGRSGGVSSSASTTVMLPAPHLAAQFGDLFAEPLESLALRHGGLVVPLVVAGVLGLGGEDPAEVLADDDPGRHDRRDEPDDAGGERDPGLERHSSVNS